VKLRLGGRLGALAIAAALCAFSSPQAAADGYDADGDTVAFLDGDGGPGNQRDIWLYDLGTGDYERATNDAAFEQDLVIAGSRVYFTVNDPVAFPLHYFDRATQSAHATGGVQHGWGLAGSDYGAFIFSRDNEGLGVFQHSATSSGPPTRLTRPDQMPSPCVSQPDADDPWVIWLASPSGPSCGSSSGTIYALNRTTGFLRTIATTDSQPARVDAGKVAIVENSVSGRQLVVYDLATGGRTIVATTQEPNIVTDFEDGRIAYHAPDGDPRPTSFSDRTVPWVHDLSEGSNTRVTNAVDDQGPSSGPRLAGDWVVFQGTFDGGLYAQNLETGQRQRIRPRPVVTDQDGDGVPDTEDVCPTEFGTLPNGCPAPVDTDGDGVPDAEDQCPNTSGVPPTGCPVDPAPDFEVRAIGDSVTAAFGYYADGSPVPASEITSPPPDDRCRPPKPPDGRCQSPNVAAYPAVWAESHDIPIRSPAYENLAISGSTADQWADAGGEFRDELESVVTDDPDLVLMTLGANPLLTDFAFDPFKLTSFWCLRFDPLSSISTCVQKRFKKLGVADDLVTVYTRLLDGTDATIGVFLYHETYPKGLVGDISRRKIRVLFNELNAQVATAFARARRERPQSAERLRLLRPPLSFDEHGCKTFTPWVLKTDHCVHPNLAGHEAFASVIDKKLFPEGLP
jgi:hypothetical protein